MRVGVSNALEHSTTMGERGTRKEGKRRKGGEESEKDETTHQSNQTVRMEGVVAREDVELAGHEREGAVRAPLRGVHGHEALLQRGDVLLDRLCVLRRLVHVRLELVDVRRVPLERGADLLLEVVDDDEVGEERQDVLDLEQIRVLEEAHRPVDEYGSKCISALNASHHTAGTRRAAEDGREWKTEGLL